MVVVHRSDELTDGLPTSAGACGPVYTVIVKLVGQTFHLFTHFHTRIVIGTQFPAIILLTASIGAVFHRTYPGSLPRPCSTATGMGRERDFGPLARLDSTLPIVRPYYYRGHSNVSIGRTDLSQAFRMMRLLDAGTGDRRNHCGFQRRNARAGRAGRTRWPRPRSGCGSRARSASR